MPAVDRERPFSLFLFFHRQHFYSLVIASVNRCLSVGASIVRALQKKWCCVYDAIEFKRLLLLFLWQRQGKQVGKTWVQAERRRSSSASCLAPPSWTSSLALAAAAVVALECIAVHVLSS